MSHVSYYALALSICKLLLTAAGLLLVFFDWSAARRREFLYIYFNEEKPGFNYFAAARRRRAQYTLLLIAFSILFVGDFFSAIMYAAVSPVGEWTAWLGWWQSDWQTTTHLSNAVSLAAGLQMWNICLTSLGVLFLAVGFLYHPSSEKTSLFDVVARLYVALWFVLVVFVLTGWFGVNAYLLSNVINLLLVLIVTVGVVAYTMMNLKEVVKPGLLNYDPLVLGIAFILLWVGIAVRYLFGNPIWTPLFSVIAFVPIIWMVAKGVLNEYEMVEMSRHRLGRERQTVVTFLKRIGSAFTTAMDLKQVLHLILESALETTDAAAGAIYLYNKETQLLEPRDVVNFFPPLYVESTCVSSPDRTETLEAEMKHQSFQLGEGILGEVAEQGQARIINDVQAAGIMIGGTAEYLRNRSMLVVPLRIREEPLGVMAVLCKQRGSFENEDRMLLRALADQGSLFINNALLTGEVAQQERLRRDLQIARDIQQRLLPEKCPEVPGFDIAAIGSAATEVGGDYYDFFWINDTHLGFVVADVSGKGVHAALIAAMIRSIFRTQARGNTDVRSSLSQANGFIGEDLRSDMFVTCIYGILDTEKSTFEWGRAGHEPLIVAHESGETEVFSPNGFALGVVPSSDFDELLEVETVHLKKGDRILIFTDGLTEAMNEDEEEFGMQRILDFMNNHKSSAAVDSPTLSDTFSDLSKGERDLQALEQEVTSHVGDAAQSDDLTIVYLGVK
ncbi:MAG: GAF domain-containing SpoIIE family protein phosphatase [Abditibacteriaceae bacterium]